MMVRIRFGRGATVRRGRGKNRKVIWAVAALLTPAAVMAFALGAWRLAADLGWARKFVFESGLLSHWQVWLALAAVIEICAWALSRYGTSATTQEGVGPQSSETSAGLG